TKPEPPCSELRRTPPTAARAGRTRREPRSGLNKRGRGAHATHLERAHCWTRRGAIRRRAMNVLGSADRRVWRSGAEPERSWTGTQGFKRGRSPVKRQPVMNMRKGMVRIRTKGRASEMGLDFTIQSSAKQPV
ncbi:hypothetical protein Z043_117562, partial [Scleropages formosus]